MDPLSPLPSGERDAQDDERVTTAIRPMPDYEVSLLFAAAAAAEHADPGQTFAKILSEMETTPRARPSLEGQEPPPMRPPLLSEDPVTLRRPAVKLPPPPPAKKPRRSLIPWAAALVMLVVAAGAVSDERKNGRLDHALDAALAYLPALKSIGR